MSFFCLALLVYSCSCANSTDFNIISAANFNETVANGNWLFVAFRYPLSSTSFFAVSIVCSFKSVLLMLTFLSFYSASSLLGMLSFQPLFIVIEVPKMQENVSGISSSRK